MMLALIRGLSNLIGITALLFLPELVFSQDLPKPRTDIIPHSPEVEAMVKHTALPVTLYTGMPQISIPIHEIKASGLTIPFSLSYNYNGNKPTETASWVGLGWSLQGGGSISRIIKGKVDGVLNSGYNYEDIISPEALTWSQPFLYGVNNGAYDTEPDIYMFHIGNYSGKFILIGGQAYLFPFQNIKIISQGASGFKMTDEHGNIYLFNDIETTFQRSLDVPIHTSAWNISKIITADKIDTINYSYNTYTFKHPPTFNDNYSITTYGAGNQGLNNSGHTFYRIRIESDLTYALALSSVSGRNGTISFKGSIADRQDVQGGKMLEKIIISGPFGSSLNKEMDLVHDYSAVGKLTLRETFEFTNSDKTDQHYFFEYQDQTKGPVYSTDASAIDYWGFANGAYNPMLFADGEFGPDPVQPYGNRKANSGVSSNGIIKKITYPGGGYSTFEFEQNKSGSFDVTYSYKDSTLSTAVNYDPNSQVNGRTEVFKAFTVVNPQPVYLTYGDNDDFNIPTQSILRIYKDSIKSIPVYTSPLYQDGSYTHNDTTWLAPGNYFFSISCENGIIGSDLNFTGTSGTLRYSAKVARYSSTLADGPGLRVKKICSYDGMASTPSLVKRYEYNKGSLALGRTNYSSSALEHYCITYYDFSFSAGVGSAINELAENSFYYGEVTEVTQDSTKTGKTVYTFGTESSQLLDVKLGSQTDYKYTSNGFVPIKKVTNEYQLLEKNGFVGLKGAYKSLMATPDELHYCVLWNSPDLTQPDCPKVVYSPNEFYALVSDHTLLSSTKEFLYNDDGTSSINETNYYYDNSDHLLPTRIITFNSNGEQFTQEMKYPLDYNFNSLGQSLINDKFKIEKANALMYLGSNYSNLIRDLTPYQPYNTTNTDFINVTNKYNLISDYTDSVKAVIANREAYTAKDASNINDAITNASFPSWKQAVAWMQLHNVTSPIIEKYVSIKKADGNEYLLYATRNEYGIRNLQTAEPVSIKQTEIKTNILKSSFLVNPEAYYKPQLDFTYDKSAKLVSQQKINDSPSTYLYGYAQVYPIAEIKNASFQNVLAALGLTEDQYIAESKRGVLTDDYSERIKSLRQKLPIALITTYTYDPLIGITSITDPNNRTTYYRYDSFGRLNVIKDNNFKILKTFNYHYKQVSSPAN